MTSFLAS